MNKTIIIADNHLGKFWKSNNSNFNKGRKLINNFIDNMNDIISKYRGAALIFAGDIFDSVHANTEMLVYIKQKLNTVFNNNNFNNIYAIARNHETFIDKDGHQQTLLTIGLDSNVKVYIDDISHEIINNVNYVFIPFQNNLEELIKNSLKDHLNKELNNILILHMTPKEIFSYSKYSIKEMIDMIDDEYKIPYILLGHYHLPCETSYKNTKIISIGNSYYLDITDLKNRKNSKRYVVLDNDDISLSYEKYNKLPEVVEYDIESQSYFDSNIINEINDKYDTDIIIYLKSKVLIDYSALIFSGYDVYFELTENTDDNLITLHETLSNSFNSNSDKKSLNDRWDKYLDTLNISDKEKELCSFLFEKRNDSDLKINDIFQILSEEVI